MMQDPKLQEEVGEARRSILNTINAAMIAGTEGGNEYETMEYDGAGALCADSQ